MQYTNPKYTYRKDGVFYFSKQVPNDVRSYYSKQRIVLCLRTKSPHRVIPLVGASLWVAQRIKQNGSEYCFPRYTDGVKCNSNSASAALNKWIKQVAGSDNVIRGFRHSFKDKLRAISAPIDMIDQSGGWSLQSVGQGYGYSINAMCEILGNAVL